MSYFEKMEEYYKPPQAANTTESTSNSGNEAHESVQSDFDQYRRSLIAQEIDEGWQSEKRRYVNKMPADVTRDTDVVKWWEVHYFSFIYNHNRQLNIYQNNGKHYPTLARIALDVLPCAASSVPTEQAFSGGGITADKRRSRLNGDKFEELQIMKHAWRPHIQDLAAINSGIIEEVVVDEYQDQEYYQDRLHADAFADEYEIELVVDDTIVEDITLVD